jgi:GTP-binding protein HflX
LPKELFAAFRATFEEAQDADLLLHVVDVSDPAHEEHMLTTEHLLEELELTALPVLRVFNKADVLSPGEADDVAKGHHGLAVTALDNESLKPLLVQMEQRLFAARGAGARIAEPPADMEPSVDWDVVAED